MKRPSLIAGGVFALFAVLLSIWIITSDDGETESEEQVTAPLIEPDSLSEGQQATVQTPEFQMRDTENARLLKFDGVEGAMDVRVGGPGLDAAFEATIVGGLMPIPLEYEGEDVPTMEVRAVSEEGCFWGDVGGAEEQVSLVPGGRLRVKLVDPAGRSISDAEVRVGRDFLSFLFEEGASNEDGIFDVECVPEGDYAVSITAAGFVTEHVRTRVPGDLELTLTRGYRLDGHVRNTLGEAISQATLLISTCTEGVCVPESIAASSESGNFTADNLRASTLRILARHPKYETIEVQAEAGSPMKVEMKNSKPRTFRVIDGQSRAVASAVIEWEGVVDRGRGVSDASGEWEDRGAPIGAKARASLGKFVSPWVEVQGTEVQLNVESPSMQELLLRIDAPEEIVSLDVTLSSSSAHCPSERLNLSDFRLICKQGDARVNIDMGRGIFSTVASLKGASTLRVPRPQSHVLRIESGDLPSAEVDYGRGWQVLEVIKSKDGEWKAEFSFWGESVRVRVRAAGVEDVVTVKGSQTKLELRPAQTHRLWVLDAQGSPVTGAWIGVVDSSGVRQKWATSSGQLPFERRVREGENLDLFIVDPRRGAASTSLGGGRTESRIELRRPVLESPPEPYLTLSAAQSIIGASLVEDRPSYRIDEMNEEAQKAGVTRGAWWVAGWKEAAGTRVVLWNGKNYTEHTIKAN